jgi:hypothetical protein
LVFAKKIIYVDKRQFPGHADYSLLANKTRGFIMSK